MSALEPLKISQRDGVTLIELGIAYQKIDGSNIEQLLEVILETAHTAEPPLVVIDLPCTQYVNSLFLEFMLRVFKRLSVRGGRLALGILSPVCREIVALSRLDTLWNMYV